LLHAPALKQFEFDLSQPILFLFLNEQLHADYPGPGDVSNISWQNVLQALSRICEQELSDLRLGTGVFVATFFTGLAAEEPSGAFRGESCEWSGPV